MARGISLMLLLDTHTFIWLASDRSLLSDRVLKMIQEESGRLFISSITVTEIGLLANADRINTYGSSKDFIFKNLKRLEINEVPVDVEIAFYSAQLPPIHRDPFDRIIIATALEHGMPILTKDRIIPRYPKVKAVWE
ncbi:type II toxin-antitoxin system VapC family toxin [Pontiellaceae bacterium B1224]|nr:type II toxin-antitoxin system VapC family toxin [Pontiellaceae bacterium B1224]